MPSSESLIGSYQQFVTECGGDITKIAKVPYPYVDRNSRELVVREFSQDRQDVSEVRYTLPEGLRRPVGFPDESFRAEDILQKLEEAANVAAERLEEKETALQYWREVYN